MHRSAPKWPSASSLSSVGADPFTALKHISLGLCLIFLPCLPFLGEEGNLVSRMHMPWLPSDDCLTLCPLSEKMTLVHAA